MQGTARRLGLTILLALTTAPARASMVSYSNVVVFGDSLSDVGNTANNFWVNFFAPQAEPPYYNGRFSNGPVWVETLGNKLGHSTSTRSSAGGDNYARGGALAGTGSNFLGFIDNLGNQVGDYTGSHSPTGNELFVLWGGGNDFIEIGGSLGEIFSGGGSASGVSTQMRNRVSELYADGARNFLVLNLPRLGEIPRYNNTTERNSLNAVSIDYNNQLASKLAGLESMPGIDITLFDVQSLFDRMLSQPDGFGFTNTTGAAYNESNGSIAPNANSYVFWDPIHPTAAAHTVLANAAFVALHDPGDFTGDGVVNGQDLQRVLSRYAQATSPFNLDLGDWDGDGAAGVFELDLVLANWTPPATGTVPEPGSALILVVLTLAGRPAPRRTRRRCGR